MVVMVGLARTMLQSSPWPAWLPCRPKFKACVGQLQNPHHLSTVGMHEGASTEEPKMQNCWFYRQGKEGQAWGENEWLLEVLENRALQTKWVSLPRAEPWVVYVRAQTHLAKDRQKGVLTDIVIKLTETRCGGPQGELCSLLMLLKRFYLRLTTALMTCKKLSQWNLISCC